MVEILPFLVARKVSREEKRITRLRGYATSRRGEEEGFPNVSKCFVSFRSRAIKCSTFPSFFSLIIGFRRHRRWRIIERTKGKEETKEKKKFGSFDPWITLILFINTETKRLTSLEWISYGKRDSLVFLLISGWGREGSIFCRIWFLS